LSFSDWVLHVHAGLHNAGALHARFKRHAHLPTPNLTRLRLWRERALRKAEKRWS
jgi:hypothetical protein